MNQGAQECSVNAVAMMSEGLISVIRESFCPENVMTAKNFN